MPDLLKPAKKRAARRPAEPAPSQGVLRLRERLRKRAKAIKAQVRKWKKGNVPAKVLAAYVGAFSPKPRLASWRQRVLSPVARRARTRKRRTAMVKASRRANR